MRDSQLARWADRTLAAALETEAAAKIRHALDRGNSPVCILRNMFAPNAPGDMRWLLTEAVMTEWCRAELVKIREAGPEGSAKHKRVERWLDDLTMDCEAPLPAAATLETRVPPSSPRQES